MNRYSKLIVALFSMSFSIVASSETIDAEFTVSQIGASLDSQTVFVNVNESASSTQGCNTKVFKMSIDNPFADKFYSTILVAHTSGKKLKFRWDPDAACYSLAIAPKVFWLLD